MAIDDEATLRAAVERVLRVPGSSRRFDQTPAHAARVHRIGPQLMERLLDLGLPHAGAGDERLFDTLDLENIGLALRIGPRWRVLLPWAAAFAEAERIGGADYTLTVNAGCPVPERRHSCDFAMHPNLLAAVGEARETAPGSYTLPVAGGTGEPYFFGGEFTALVAAVRPLTFHIVHPQLAADLGFLRETQLADCRLATAYLLALGREHGLPVRMRSGLLSAIPYPVWHAWVDFGTAEGWQAADPFFVLALQRWGVLDAERWPPNRSVRGLVWPLGTEHFALVRHGRQVDGVPTTVVNETLVTRMRERR